MPFPDSLKAVRRWLDPEWRRFDPDAEPREVNVRVDFEETIERSQIFTVEARNVWEAHKLACAAAAETTGNTIDVLDVRTLEPAAIEQPSLFGSIH